MSSEISNTAPRIPMKVGEVYYSIYFVDDDLKYPFIGSYVFLGANVLGGELESTWYFQDCESFAKGGAALHRHVDDASVLGLTGSALDNILDSEGLVDALRRAFEHRKS